MREINDEFNTRKRLSINDFEVAVILQSFMVSYYAYCAMNNPDIGIYKSLSAQKMLSLIARFEKMKNLGTVTQGKIAETKPLIEKLYFDNLGGSIL